MELEIDCPYCGEAIAIWVDAGGGGAQQYVEDCSVCCRPIELSVAEGEDGEPVVSAQRGDE
jgi:hypothetical protein